jgi:hydroxymethylglutaryl-CoA lyase
MRRPTVMRRDGLPARVEICEVGPRDGLQNEAAMVPLAVKRELIERLVGTGLRCLELTSLVRPDLVPQLADAEDLLASLPSLTEVRCPVLVPNRRGLERALSAGSTSVAVFASATESFAQANLRRSRAQSLLDLTEVAREARRCGLSVRGYISMCFGDPWEGGVAEDDVIAVHEALTGAGCDEVSIGDTIGVATAGQVQHLLARLQQRGFGPQGLAVHFHDTFGQALANTLAALETGITVIDTSVGGLGGCPFAKSATGNLATEDLVWFLDGLGIESGVDLPALVQTADWITGYLGRKRSRTLDALSGPLGDDPDGARQHYSSAAPQGA